MSKLILVRHGETELNSSQRYWGKTDVALGATGLKQAAQLCARLKETDVDCIYSSEMKRAVTTAGMIASAHNLETIPCSELNEINFGRIEGLNFAEVSAQFPEIARLWMEKSAELTYPGGESLKEMEKRVAGFRQRLVKHGEKETLLIVAHAGILRTLICQLMGMEMKHRWMIKLDLASISVIETYPEGPILCSLNDISHLNNG